MQITNFLPDLPLSNPTLIFFVVLAIILLSPILLRKIGVPHIIGLILAGVIIGPHGLGILRYDTSFKLFGQVGLLYLMFLAGLEMDMNEFRKNKVKGLVFGLYTFIIPMVLGVLAGYYILELTWIQSTLLASMFASHTLVAYPIIGRYGIAKKSAVTISIAGTIITVILALLILAIITGMYRGELNTLFWVRFGLSILVYTLLIFLIFPRVSRWFLRKYDDSVSQYIFVLGVVFAASFAAELSGLEGIIGAFLAGIVLNRYIPAVSPLANRIEFVGNALFIPYFLIGVGMLVNIKVLFEGPEALIVAITMSSVATISKWISSWLTQKSFSMSVLERQLIFGLTNGQAAATLAVVLIAYNIVIGTNPDGTEIRLLNENILNGTIIMILITCTISSIITEKAAREMATLPETKTDELESSQLTERILIPVANPATLNNLMNLALMVKDKKRNLPLYALSVKTEREEEVMNNEENVLHKVGQIAAAADTDVRLIRRYDINVASGIIHTIKENKITDIIVGFHHKANIIDSFFGQTIQNILRRTNRMILILKATTALETINKMMIVVPARAQFEIGFDRWVLRLGNMASQIGCRMLFACDVLTQEAIQKKLEKTNFEIRTDFITQTSWDQIGGIKSELEEHDLLILISARHTSISYHHSFEKLPVILSRHFSEANLLVLYPEQFGEANEDATFFHDPQAGSNRDKGILSVDGLSKINDRIWGKSKS